MINQEEKLRGYLSTFLNSHKEATALQLKISLIEEDLRNDSLIMTILSSLIDALEVNGQAFCLKNDDIFIIYNSNLNDNFIKAILIRIWIHFSNDPQTSKAEQILERRYKLPFEMDILKHEISRIGNGPSRTTHEKKERKKFVAPLVYDKHEKLFTPEMLARVSKALQNTDFSNMIRRQSVCIILDEAYPQPLFEEVFVSIADLGESILPGVSLTATPWLFQDLTETLDKRVLSSVSRHDDGAFTHAFSLNLNISTILSEDFRDFDNNIRSNMRNTIVLELQPIDIFSDLQSYLMARDYAQNLGYKICIDGVTLNTLKFIDRERLAADYLKLMWSSDLPYALQEDTELTDCLLNIGANRAILCRIDDEEALKVAKKYNITLFQGRYVQHLIAKNPRNRRVGTTLLRKY
ncbi:MAG: EAL domain-containing protein [Alphaproteobacteria bacterium]|nr:EAL domain-containing protein [Alphaproteobacteria bacterium]